MIRHVQSSAGTAITGTTGNISLAGTAAGNILIVQFLQDGSGANLTYTGISGCEDLAGSDGNISTLDSIQVGGTFVAALRCSIGRSLGGTASFDVESSAGDDLFGMIHEFSGVATGATLATVCENGGGATDQNQATSATIGDADVVTNGDQRLAVQLIGVATEQALAAFTGETGGDWTEPVAELASAAGTAGTVGLQIAEMPSAGTIGGGTITISSAAWGVIGFAFIPRSARPGRNYRRLVGPAALASTPETLYTVPENARALIRNIYANNPSASPVGLTLGIAVPTAYSSAVLADSPRAYYRMGEASGQPQDSSGNANHTTTTEGSPTYSQVGAIASDPSQTAITLNSASSEAFTAPHHSTLNLVDTLTLEFWIKRISIGAINSVIHKLTGAYQTGLLAANTLFLAKPGSGVIVESTITITDTTTWHHCVATKSGATVKLYIDGVDVTGTVTNQTMIDNTDILRLGRSFGGEFTDAVLDEIAIYPTALSAARVLAHYQAAQANGIFDADTIPAGDILFARRETNYVLEAGEVLQGYASVEEPVFVGAGAGTVITTGTGTVTKTGCIAGNLLLMHLYEDNVAQEFTRSNRVNIEALNGTDNADTFYQTGVSVGVAQVGNHSIFSGRVMADGTCSWDVTVGASGGDVSARIYEFSGVSTATTNITIGENVGGSGGGLYRATAATNTTPGDADVVTGDVSRLALNFLVIQGAQTIGAFTGETGGDWTEAVAEYTHSTGNGVTLQLQTASMPAAGTINGGTITITSAPWGVMGFALIPATPILVVDGVEYGL